MKKSLIYALTGAVLCFVAIIGISIGSNYTFNMPIIIYGSILWGAGMLLIFRAIYLESSFKKYNK